MFVAFTNNNTKSSYKLYFNFDIFIPEFCFTEKELDKDGAILNDLGEYVGGLKGINLSYFGARYYDPELAGWLSMDKAGQFADPYAYAGNGANPVIMVDEDGNFITWSFGSDGFSIGLNFTPIGIPLGFGMNVGWGNGASIGGYGEVGYRVGGTGFGLNGGTVSQSLDYNFKHDNTSTSTTLSAGASFGIYNAGASVSNTYDITNDQHSQSWGLSAGVGFGDGMGNSIGANIGYGGDFHGNNQWSFGIGGTMDKQGHYDRMEKNEGLELTDLSAKKWKLVEEKDRIYHNFDIESEMVLKYINRKTGQEMVVAFSSTGEPMILNHKNDPTNAGSPNIVTPGGVINNIGHVALDIVPYIVYGNYHGDRTSFAQRLFRPLSY